MKTYIKLATGLFILGSAFLSASPVFAMEFCSGTGCGLYRQDISSTNSGVISGHIGQKLGNGLTGVVDGVSMMVFWPTISGGNTQKIYIRLDECTDSSYTVCQSGDGVASTTQVLWQSVGFQNATSSIQLPFQSEYSLDPAKYYVFTLFNGPSGEKALGSSSTGAWAGGDAYGTFFPNAVKDLAFYLSGVQTSYDLPSVSNLSPINGSTTATTLVNFNFDYHAPTSYNITNYLINITDNAVSATTSNNFSLTGLASSGDHSISRTVTLTSDHYYTWNACIYNSSDSQLWCDTYTRYFAVVDSSALQNYFGDSGTSATSTNNTGDVFAIRAFLDTILSKIPFSYVRQIYSIWQEALVADTDDEQMPLIELNLSNLQIASSSVYRMSDLKITTSSIISFMGVTNYNGIIALQDVSYFIGVMWYYWRRIIGLFKSV